MPAEQKEGNAFLHNQRLPKKERLHAQKEFVYLRTHGKRKSGKYLVLLYEVGGSHPIIGIAVGKRVGGAVVRSVVRRRIRESYRRSRWALRSARMLFIAKTGAAKLRQGDLQREMIGLWRRAFLWKGDAGGNSGTTVDNPYNQAI